MSDKKTEALKLALEALECALSDDRPYIVQCEAAITTIREALAEQPAQQQEPVAWPVDMLERIDAAIQRITSGQGCMRVPPDKTDPDLVLAEIRKLIKSSPPASKPLVGLTEEELWDLWNAHTEQPFPEWFVDFKRAYQVIEAKLKEKNNG